MDKRVVEIGDITELVGLITDMPEGTIIEIDLSGEEIKDGKG